MKYNRQQAVGWVGVSLAGLLGFAISGCLVTIDDKTKDPVDYVPPTADDDSSRGDGDDLGDSDTGDSDTPSPRCGDGHIDQGEGCDDGDQESADGCSGECQVESLYRCEGEPSKCVPMGDSCADAIPLVEGTFTLRQGDFHDTYGDYMGICMETYSDSRSDAVFVATVAPHGHLHMYASDVYSSLYLSTACPDIESSCTAYAKQGGSLKFDNPNDTQQEVFVTVELPYSPDQITIAAENHVIACGDGFVDGAEQCDDGDKGGSDGCSEDCQVEGGWHCGGEPSFCFLGGDSCESPAVLPPGQYDLPMASDSSMTSPCGALTPHTTIRVSVPPQHLFNASAPASDMSGSVMLSTDCSSECADASSAYSYYSRRGVSHVNRNEEPEDVYLTVAQATVSGSPNVVFDVVFGTTALADLPPGDTCASAPLLGPGTYEYQWASFHNTLDNTDSQCGGVFTAYDAGPDAFFKVDVAAGATLVAKLITPSTGGERQRLWLVRDCERVGETCLASNESSDAVQLSYKNSGTASEAIFVVVDSGSERAGSFKLALGLN